MRRRIAVGLLLLRSGNHALIAEACRSGALAAIARVNADPDLDLAFVPGERDLAGSADAYTAACEDVGGRGLRAGLHLRRPADLGNRGHAELGCQLLLPALPLQITETRQLSGAALAPDTPVLSAEGLTDSVNTEGGLRPQVSDLSFTLGRGETLAIAVESGPCKSITPLAILGLLPPPFVRVTRGAVRLGATDLTALPEAAMRAIRGDRIAMVFQAPMTSINPALTVGLQLTEAIRAHTGVAAPEAREQAVSAVDVSVQARVLALMRELQRDLGIA